MRSTPKLAVVAVVMLAVGTLRSNAAAQEPQPPPPPAGQPPAQQAPPQQAPAAAQEQAAQPSAPAAPVTLGEFAVKVAERLKMQAPGGTFTAEAAAWALLQAGIKLRGELGSHLTEADAVSALADLGYNVRTKTPSRLVTRDRLEVILTTFVKPSS